MYLRFKVHERKMMGGGGGGWLGVGARAGEVDEHF